MEAAARSAIERDTFGDAFFSPRAATHAVRKGDVGFVVVDARPENKPLFSGTIQARSPFASCRSRARGAAPGQHTLEREWSLESWDIRSWCASPQKFTAALNSLRRVDFAEKKKRVAGSEPAVGLWLWLEEERNRARSPFPASTGRR